MKRIVAVVLITVLFSSLAFGQEETRRHSSGPRRQLATIVFAGLGGAILGLSTLSFYGRPQDQLTNIAIGFAVGIIAGTTYVTIRSATTRDYYDEKPQSFLGIPRENLMSPELAKQIAVTERMLADPIQEEPALIYGPMIAKDLNQSTVYGGTIALRF